MLRQSLLLGVASMAFATAGQAQQRGQTRDDLLDALTRHIQICGEITEIQQRLSYYDRLQTQVGGVAPQASKISTIGLRVAAAARQRPLTRASARFPTLSDQLAVGRQQR